MNNEPAINPESVQRKRPKLVWVISMFYFISLGWVLFSFASMYFGFLPVNEARAAYFKSMTIIDILFTVIIYLLDFAGAIYLFLLKRGAFRLLLSSFALTLLRIVYLILFRNLLAAITYMLIIEVIIGWIITIAIILYIRKLVKTEMLR